MILFSTSFRMSTQPTFAMSRSLSKNSAFSKSGCLALLLLVISPFLSFWWGSSFRHQESSAASWLPMCVIMTVAIMAGLSLLGLLICCAGIKAREEGELLIMATMAHGLIVSVGGLTILAAYLG